MCESRLFSVRLSSRPPQVLCGSVCIQAGVVKHNIVIFAFSQHAGDKVWGTKQQSTGGVWFNPVSGWLKGAGTAWQNVGERLRKFVDNTNKYRACCRDTQICVYTQTMHARVYKCINTNTHKTHSRARPGKLSKGARANLSTRFSHLLLLRTASFVHAPLFFVLYNSDPGWVSDYLLQTRLETRFTAATSPLEWHADGEPASWASADLLMLVPLICWCLCLCCLMCWCWC